MKTLIIPDIHLKHRKAQQIIDNESFDQIIFGGDFFDDFDDTPDNNRETAEWVKSTIEKYKCRILLSNHDIAYRYPNNHSLRCSGFDNIKSMAINGVLNTEDWSRFELFIEEQGFVFTHAGISKKLYSYICKSKGVRDTLKQDLLIKLFQDETPLAMELCKDNFCHPFFQASYYRGGMSSVPGLNWCDYGELIPIKNVNQIFFHTPYHEPLCKTMRDNGVISNWRLDHYLQETDYNIASFNYNLDTHLKFYATIEDKRLQVFSCFNRKYEFNKQLVYTKQH